MNHPQLSVGDGGWQAHLPSAPELSRVWAQLLTGELKVAGHGARGDRCWLGLERIAVARRTPLVAEDANIVQQVLTGRPQKCLAIELCVSASTISGQAVRGLQALGSIGCASRAPLALALVAACHRQRQSGALAAWPAQIRECDAQAHVWMTRPEAVLLPWLSTVEHEIVELALAGVSHREISRQRGRSGRTIANQLHSIYDKLGVSGRFQLVHLAVVLANCADYRQLKRCAAKVRSNEPLQQDWLQFERSSENLRLAASG